MKIVSEMEGSEEYVTLHPEYTKQKGGRKAGN
jgi:hypothetical protein